MTVNIKLWGSISERLTLTKNGLTYTFKMDLPEDSSVQDAIAQLLREYPALRGIVTKKGEESLKWDYGIMLNKVICRPEAYETTKVSAGDEILLLPVFIGG